jgi:hypothetical protein
MVVYTYLLLFFSLSMKICDSALFCSPAMIFYYWIREFNQAIVFLSGTRCTVDMLNQKMKTKTVDVGKKCGLNIMNSLLNI